MARWVYQTPVPNILILFSIGKKTKQVKTSMDYTHNVWVQFIGICLSRKIFKEAEITLLDCLLRVM